LHQLSSRTAFVTGGASGIGLGMVKAFLDVGMKVVVADVRDDHLEHAVTELGRSDDLLFLHLDVTDRQAYKVAADAAIQRFGRIHVLCNNAGVGIMGAAQDLSYADWDWSLGVNLGGVFNGVHTFLPHLLAHDEGAHIVNTASVGAVLPAGIAYGAPKAAVLAMSEGLRTELADRNIGVTCLMPGPVSSNIHEVALLRPARYSDTQLHASEKKLAERAASPHWMDPMEVGHMVVDAIQRNLAFIFTHNEHRDGVARRFEAILAAFPRDPVDAERAANLGFRISNPIYEQMLKANEPPARGRKRQGPRQ
jgi:NAD(P)-dependent dehydrogenase (short-subunit alcohol dehydrogenase family)